MLIRHRKSNFSQNVVIFFLLEMLSGSTKTHLPYRNQM